MNPILRSSFMALLLGLALPARADMLVNGSFEPAAPLPGSYLALPGGSTAIPGWTTTNGGVEWFDPAAFGYTPAPAGTYIVGLSNPTFSSGGIEQSFPTQPGDTYIVFLFVGTLESQGSDGTVEVVISAAGKAEALWTANHSPTLAWTPQFFYCKATDFSTTLSLSIRQDANLHFAFVDAVTVDFADPARPTSWGRIKGSYR